MVVKMSGNSTNYIQKNINIKLLFLEFLRKWYYIVGSIVILVVFSLMYTAFFVTPMYSSIAKIMVFNKQTATTINDMELSASSYLVRDFTEIISDKVILKDVAEDLDNKYSHAQLKSYITINNPTSTRIIEIIAMSPNAEDSKKIVDSICNVSQEKLVELMGLDRINLISYGDVAKNPSQPNFTRTAFYSFWIGLLIGAGIVLILYLNDNKVSSVEDIEKNLGLSVLATIPYNNKNNGVKK